MMPTNLKENERIDDLERNGLKIIQDPDRFCFGIDAVLLSHFASAGIRKGQRVLDMCTGTGIVPILLTAKTEALYYAALEIQVDSAEMASRSVILNNLQDKMEVVTGDVKEASKIFGLASFDAITCNPPYMIDNHGLKNDDSPKTIARHEVLCTLDDVIREASLTLRDHGRFFMVHRPFRLAEIFSTMSKYKLEPKRMQLVHPYIDKEPNMVLIEGCKNGKSRLTIEKPLIVYKEPGVYTDEIHEIYGY